MTVSTQVTRVIVEGNGVTTVFSYSFPIPGSSATDQTNAELTLLAPDGTITDIADNLWSITGVQGTSGTFTFNPGSPLTTGNFLTLNRVVPYLQTTTLSAQGAYSPEVVEAALDNLAFQTEQLNTVALQSLRAPITDAALNDLPTEVLRANRYLAFDTNGQATVSGVLNTASGYLIVETASTTLTAINALSFSGAVTVSAGAAGIADIDVTAASPGGSTDQIQYNAGSDTFGGLTFSGDMTVAVPGGTASLSTTGVTSGTFQVATVTVNSKGRVTAISTGSLSGSTVDITDGTTTVSATTASFISGAKITSPGGGVAGITIPPPPTAAGSTLAVTAAMSNADILLNTASGSVCTLPAATGSGARYRFVVTVAVSTNFHIVNSHTSADHIFGGVILITSGVTYNYANTVSNADQFKMNGSTTGGFTVGDWIEFFDDATNVWTVRGMIQQTGGGAAVFFAV